MKVTSPAHHGPRERAMCRPASDSHGGAHRSCARGWCFQAAARRGGRRPALRRPGPAPRDDLGLIPPLWSEAAVGRGPGSEPWWTRPVEGAVRFTPSRRDHSTESDPGSAGVSGIHLARPINRRFSGGRSRFCGRVELSAREHTGKGERRAVNTGRYVHRQGLSGRGRKGLSSSVEAR